MAIKINYMKINPIFQENEEYYCLYCEKVMPSLAPNKKGNCPVCEKKMNIKLNIDNYFHACNRVSPNELKVGEIISLDLKNSYEILAIEEYESYYRIALKGYRAINFDKDSIITKIDGSWS